MEKKYPWLLSNVEKVQDSKLSFLKSTFCLYLMCYVALYLSGGSIALVFFFSMAVLCSIPTLITVRKQQIHSILFIVLLFFMAVGFFYTSRTIGQSKIQTTLILFALFTLNWLVPSIEFISFRKVKIEFNLRYLLPIFTAMGFLVLLIIFNRAGLDWFVKHGDYSRFPYTWQIWETKPIKEHFFLTYDYRWAKFENRVAYHGYSPIYLLLHYFPIKILSVYKGLSFTQLVRLSPFVTLTLVICVLPAFLSKLFANRSDIDTVGSPADKKLPLREKYYESAFGLSCIAGIFISMISVPDLLSGPLVFDADNSFPMSAFFQFFFVISFYFFRKKALPIAVGTAYALLCPIPAAMFFLATTGFAFILNESNLIRWGFLSLLIGVVGYIMPKLIAQAAGIEVGGSSLLTRSGLDGDSSYFTGVYRSLIEPQHQVNVRNLSFFWPAMFLTFVSFLVSVTSWCPKEHKRAIFLITSGWLFESILFPQSRSIHPYLYDVSASVGGIGCFAVALSSIQRSRPELAKSILPWTLLMLFSFAYNNAIMITRIFRNF